jgi:hypothetical protein
MQVVKSYCPSLGKSAAPEEPTVKVTAQAVAAMILEYVLMNLPPSSGQPTESHLGAVITGTAAVAGARSSTH